MPAIPPEELVRWCQRTLPDDTRAFEALIAQYKQSVFATAYRLMGNRQEAEDQSQEVFLKIYRGIKGLAEPATLTTWIYRITTNTCLDALDKQQRRPATIPLTADEEEGDEADYADARAQTPEESILREELRNCLEQTLIKLATEERSVLILRDVEDCSYQEVAAILEIGLSAVKMRIHRARLAFKRLLEQICPESWTGAANIS